MPRPRAGSRLGRLLWGAFLLAEFPLLVAVTAGWGAGYLHPGPFWWAQLCAAFLPYLAVALGAVTAVPLLFRRWGWVLVHAVPLVLVLSRGLPGDVLAASVEPRPDDLVLMTFNVPQSGPSAEQLGDSLAALVGAVDPDLLALQEAAVYGPRAADGAYRYLPPQVEGVVRREGYRLPPVAWRAGTPELTEVPVLATRSGDPLPDVAAQTVVTSGSEADNVTEAVRLPFRWQGRDAVLYNVHLRSYGVPKPWHDPALKVLDPRTWIPYLRGYRTAYGIRAGEVEDLVTHIARERLPVIVVGDFNEGPFSWAYRQLRDAGAERTDAFRAAGEGDGRTYHARRPVVRIDYVLADPAFEVVSARVRATTFSDHRPLVVRLRWREEARPQEAPDSLETQE